ncbi:hypothetical protein M513_03034 [Trichuris suis]|uniref:Uncharacterized protein n=1 Tax=Trichuris suis TaxID=68888 RepID=A0A085MGB0_9BILA|nr:hypothetical protein M513_03034 [Trichuris suis]
MPPECTVFYLNADYRAKKHAQLNGAWGAVHFAIDHVAARISNAPNSRIVLNVILVDRLDELTSRTVEIANLPIRRICGAPIGQTNSHLDHPAKLPPVYCCSMAPTHEREKIQEPVDCTLRRAVGCVGPFPTGRRIVPLYKRIQAVV